MMYVGFGCQCLLALVFAVSTVSKVRSAAGYAEFVAATGRLVPWLPRRVRPLAAAAVVAEAATAVLILVPGTAVAGLLLGAGLLTVFTVLITAALRRGTAASCRCFGGSGARLGIRHVVRNVLLLAAAAGGFLAPAGWLGAWSAGDPSALVVAAMAAAVGAVLVVVSDVLVELFTEPVGAPRRRGG